MPRYYDPHQAPDPADWLALDEASRIAQAEKYHHKQRIRLPNAKAHATFHAIVENQIAEGDDAVLRAMARLATQGLNRHDAIHAVTWVLAEHLHGAMTSDAAADDQAALNARYFAAVERLQAKDWLALADQP